MSTASKHPLAKEIDRVAAILTAAWAKAEPDHDVTRYPTSYVATFVDMARAVIEDLDPRTAGAVDPHGSICTWPIDGGAPGNRTDCPHCRPRATPPVSWRDGVTFPVELEENEAAAIQEELRKKFMPERLKEFSPMAERLLGKMCRVLDKFRDKRHADEELAASLTDEERQIIRARRADTDRILVDAALNSCYISKITAPMTSTANKAPKTPATTLQHIPSVGEQANEVSPEDLRKIAARIRQGAGSAHLGDPRYSVMISSDKVDVLTAAIPRLLTQVGELQSHASAAADRAVGAHSPTLDLEALKHARGCVVLYASLVKEGGLPAHPLDNRALSALSSLIEGQEAR